MQVTFERRGGFTGIPLTLTLDTAALPAEQATTLQRLVEASDFFTRPATLGSTTQPDRFQYQIAIRDGDRQHTLTVAESSVPDDLQPLINFLMEVIRKS